MTTDHQRWERLSEGALVSITYRGRRGSITKDRGVVERVDQAGDAVTLHLADGARFERAQFDLGERDEYGTAATATGREAEMYQVRVVVPPSQVRHPGVSVGDVVKVRSGSTGYRVTSVDDGLVTLEDGRQMPVTEIAAFDEDVDDYDPLQVLPEWWTEVLD